MSHQLWPGCACRYCNGTGTITPADTEEQDMAMTITQEQFETVLPASPGGNGA